MHHPVELYHLTTVYQSAYIKFHIPYYYIIANEKVLNFPAIYDLCNSIIINPNNTSRGFLQSQTSGQHLMVYHNLTVLQTIVNAAIRQHIAKQNKKKQKNTHTHE